MEGILFLLVYLGAGIAIAIPLLRWIGGPLDSLARSRRHRTQFTLVDLLVLFTMLQCVVGTLHWVLSRTGAEPGSAEARDRVASVLTTDAVVAAFLLLSWWVGIAMASRAGISRWWHRTVVVGILAPCTMVSVLICVILTPTIMMLAILRLAGRNVTLEPFLLGFCAALAAVGVGGLLTRWIAAKYPPGEPARPSSAEPPAATRSTPVED